MGKIGRRPEETLPDGAASESPATAVMEDTSAGPEEPSYESKMKGLFALHEELCSREPPECQRTFASDALFEMHVQSLAHKAGR